MKRTPNYRFSLSYDEKKELVRLIYLEHVNMEGPDIVNDFQFTPGENFMSTSIYDIVTALLDVRQQYRESDPVPEAPHTGREKSTL